MSLSASEYASPESGNKIITVTRTGGSTGAVGCSYATSSGTAISGSDFTATSGTLSWLNGDVADKTFSVPITSDATAEGDELFNVSISNAIGGAVLGLTNATVEITNDDAAATVPLMGSLSFPAEDGLIEAPFQINTSLPGLIFQSVETATPVNGGLARWRVTIPVTGSYVVSASLKAPDVGANSLFLDFDQEPVTPTAIWDIVPFSEVTEDRIANWRGSGGATSEFNPKVWSLTAGIHTLYLRGREPAVEIDTITIAPYGTGGPGGSKVGRPTSLRVIGP